MLDGFSMLGANPTPNAFAIDLNTYLVNSLSTTIEFQLIPESTTVFPAISYSLKESDCVYDLDGASGTKTDTWVFDAWSPNPQDVAIASEELRLVLQGYRGLMGSTQVQTCNLHDQYSRRTPFGSGNGAVLHRFANEYLISYRIDVRKFG